MLLAENEIYCPALKKVIDKGLCIDLVNDSPYLDDEFDDDQRKICMGCEE